MKAILTQIFSQIPWFPIDFYHTFYTLQGRQITLQQRLTTSSLITLNMKQ